MRFPFSSPIISARCFSNTAGSKARKKARAFLALGLLLFGGVAAHGQSALDGFDPNANGLVRAVVVQPDGKILVGGEFTTVSPNGGAAVTRNRIARFYPDGTLDTAFDPNANTTVITIALQTDGKILVGGAFTNIGGQPRSYIARLDAVTGAADSLDPVPSFFVRAIVVQPDGHILVGGQFNFFGAVRRDGIARLDASGALDLSFDPEADNGVLGMALQSDGKILIGGGFTTLTPNGGAVVTRNRIARVNPDGTVDSAFNPNANNTVYCIAVQADGKILAGGQFTFMSGQARNNIARLDATTGLADSFNPNANGQLNSIVIQADGKILVGGNFLTIGGQTRQRIARLDAASGLPDSFDPKADTNVVSVALQADGKILIGGGFTTLAPNGGAAVTRNNIARLEADGRLDQTLNINVAPPSGSVSATAVQPDGKILIGGNFTSVLGVARTNIARLNTDGTLDTAFNPNANDIGVQSIAVQADGRILVGGFFTSIGGQTRNRIARLDATTGAADSFDPNANNSVQSIAVQADGKILLGGDFTFIGGQTRNRIARLDATTGLADSFDPNANDRVGVIAVQADGKILAGGEFFGANSIGGQTRNRIARLDATTGLADSFNPDANTIVVSLAVQADGKILAGGFFFGANSIGGQTRNYIARLDATTGLADSFNPNASFAVYSIAVQADGKILACGGFTSIGGQTRNRIARLDATTGLADSFNPNASGGAYIPVRSIAAQADGKILAGGEFTTIGGLTRNLFARLSNDTAALQNLAVKPTTISWMLGGSSPQFTRVTFASSTDNVNYTPLGNGTAAGSDWTLTGLNLSTGQNLYIRARGYYRSGQLNSSESITESVRNAFLVAAPLQLATAVSRKTHGAAGDFAIDLLNANFGPECRSSGGAHTLVFTFTNNVVSGNATVTAPSGGSVSGSPTFSVNTMTVNLTGVSDVQKITVTLSGVTDSSAQVLPDTAISMNVLAGDTSGNKIVNGSDVAQTKAQSGAPVTAANFKQDVAVNGAINGSDIALVKSRSGQSVP